MGEDDGDNGDGDECHYRGDDNDDDDDDDIDDDDIDDGFYDIDDVSRQASKKRSNVM